MNSEEIRAILEQVAGGSLKPEDAMSRLKHLPFQDLGFAKVDHHRSLRCGVPEVIYSEGKTIEQVAEIFAVRAGTGGNVLATRASRAMYEAVCEKYPEADYHEAARTITLRKVEPVESGGYIAVICAGTSDLPVAEEARVTAEILDQRVEPLYDVGVAGLHRLLAHSKVLQEANVVVVVAGMEGALASVVGGLVNCPVIAVPTSVGYGTAFGGLAALLSMLNSCASGVTVVNIDNGFAAGYTASIINRAIGVPRS